MMKQLRCSSDIRLVTMCRINCVDSCSVTEMLDM